MSGEKLVAVVVKKEDLEDAAVHLPELAELLGTYYEKMNFDGQGKQDAKDVKKDVLTGARACTILLNALKETEVKDDARCN